MQLRFGKAPAPLSRKQTKTLLHGWMPIILLSAQDGAVRYDFTLWATPLPTVKDWRKAYDWPTEGENFLNWITVKVTNTGAAQAEAKYAFEQTGKSRSAKRDQGWLLAPGESAEDCVRIPFAPSPRAETWDKEDPKRWLDRTVEYWQGVMDRAAKIEVPCRKASDALKAAHVCQLIASDHGSIHGGEGFYDEFYVRDGAYQIMEMEEAGLFDVARKAIEPFFRRKSRTGVLNRRTTNSTATAKHRGPCGNMPRSAAIGHGWRRSIQPCCGQPAGR